MDVFNILKRRDNEWKVLRSLWAQKENKTIVEVFGSLRAVLYAVINISIRKTVPLLSGF